MRILVADDDRMMRKMISRNVANWGYEPELVDNGAAVLKMLMGEMPPPMALLDWMMPAMNWPQVVRFLRSQRT